MINWNEVTVGETRIGPQTDVNMFIILWHDQDSVLLERVGCEARLLRRKSELDGHVICEWEEITEECEFDSDGVVVYPGKTVWDILRYGPGLRVWKKRKEG